MAGCRPSWRPTASSSSPAAARWWLAWQLTVLESDPGVRNLPPCDLIGVWMSGQFQCVRTNFSEGVAALSFRSEGRQLSAHRGEHGLHWHSGQLPGTLDFADKQTSRKFCKSRHGVFSRWCIVFFFFGFRFSHWTSRRPRPGTPELGAHGAQAGRARAAPPRSCPSSAPLMRPACSPMDFGKARLARDALGTGSHCKSLQRPFFCFSP